MLDFLNRQVPGLGMDTRISFLKRSEAALFTIPYEMFQGGSWLPIRSMWLSKLAKQPEASTSVGFRTPLSSYVEALMAVHRARTNGEKKSSLEEIGRRLILPIRGLSVLKQDQRSSAEEVDLLIENESDEQFWWRFGSPFLIECKHWSQPVGAKEVRDLFGKLESLGLTSAILISLKGMTGNDQRDAKLLVRQYRQKARFLVALDEKDLNEIANGLDPAQKIKQKYYEIFAF